MAVTRQSSVPWPTHLQPARRRFAGSRSTRSGACRWTRCRRPTPGHPGTAMALAPLAYTLFKRFLSANPEDTAWPDRDRFVLSSGHACVLQYSLLHLCGYDLAIADLEAVSPVGLAHPRAPRAGHTPGIEVTTGPLGQGFANAVGMAIAERFLADRFNRPGSEVVDHHIYAICSDGDMMEGISQEAASIAGQLRARQARRLLRRQPHHDRRKHLDLLRRGEPRGAPGRRRLARAAGRGLRGPRRARGGDRGGARRKPSAPRSSRSARTSPIRRRTRSTRRSPTGRRSARRRWRRPRGRWALTPTQLLGGQARVRAHVPARRRRAARRRVAGALRGLARGLPEMAEDWDLAWAGRLREGWRESLPKFAAGEEIATRSAGQKVMAAFAEFAPDDDRWRRRPGRVDEDSVRGGRRVLAGPRRAQHPVRDPRARDGRDRQRRRRARRDREALRLDIPDLLRLHARLGAPVRADGAAGRVGLDARLGRARRGRADAPAGRALRVAAGDPRAVGDPPGRRKRDRGGLAGGDRTRGRPRGAAAVPPEHRRCWTAPSSARAEGSSRAATCCGTPGAGRARADPDRNRGGGAADARGRRGRGGRGKT